VPPRGSTGEIAGGYGPTCIANEQAPGPSQSAMTSFVQAPGASRRGPLERRRVATGRGIHESAREARGELWENHAKHAKHCVRLGCLGRMRPIPCITQRARGGKGRADTPLGAQMLKMKTRGYCLITPAAMPMRLPYPCDILNVGCVSKASS
jgi:hypothetical protein